MNGDFLPLVTTAKHLGNHLSSKLNLSNFSPVTKTDILCKRAMLFDRVHQVLQQFGHYEPRMVVKLLSIYSKALYGSPLWKLNSEEHLKLNRSWNIAMKIIWDLPHSTHIRFLEPLSPVPHLESILSGRYIGFVNGLSRSAKPLIKVLFKLCSSDLGSQTGQNISFLLQKYSKLTLAELIVDRNTIKKNTVAQLSENEKWKLNIIEEVSLVKKGHLEIDFDEEQLEEILDYICTN